MLNLDQLVVSGKNNLMLAHDGPAPDGGDADFFFLPGAADAVAFKHVLRLVAAAPRRRVGDHQGRPGGRVYLPAVVPLHDLNVAAVPQHGGGLFDQLQQYVDAQRHIGGAENGGLQGGGANLGHLLRGIAGGG